MAKKTVQATPPVAGSKTSQMRAFVAAHKGDTFTATGLAKALGWVKRKTKKIKGEDGKPVEDTVKVSHNAKSAVRLARKCGAKVSKATPPAVGKATPVPVFTITM